MGDVAFDSRLDADGWRRLAKTFVEDGLVSDALDAVGRGLAAIGKPRTEVAQGLSDILERLQIHPESIALEASMAKACTDAGLFDRGLVHAERAAEGQPENPDGHRALSDALWKLGRAEPSLDALHHVLWLRPNDLDAALLLAERLVECGRAPSAKLIVNRIRDRIAPTAEGELRIGRLLRTCGMNEAALWCLEKAVALDGQSAHAHYELALAYMATNAMEAAVGELRETLALRNDWNEPLRKLIEAYRWLGRVPEAEEAEIQLRNRPSLTLDVEIEIEGQAPINQSGDFVDESEITGKLRLIPVAELLQFLAHRRLTGVLRVTSEQRRGSIEIFKGEVVGAELANSPTLQERLLSSGIVTTETLHATGLAQRELGAGAFCAALVEWDLADEKAIDRTCFTHCQGVLAELIGWEDGQIDFVSAESYEHEPKIRYEVPFILLETMRKLDEAGQ
jgi:tetratricopeptide (TPR) repeat protein